jgi:hypothetical protein
MAFKHDYTTTFTLGSHERDVVITYTVTPGSGPTGPSYASGGDPGYAAEINVERVEIERQMPVAFGKPAMKTWEPAPQWLIEIIENCPDLEAEMLSEAGEDEIAAADDYAESRWDEMRMGL